MSRHGSALRAALIALSAVALTTACAAGQQAQTAQQQSSLDGTQGSVGTLRVDGVAFHTPPAGSYQVGADVPMSVYIANSGTAPDRLTNVSSPAFPGGWSVVPSAAAASSTPAPNPPGSAAASGPAQQVGAGSAVSLGLLNLRADGTGSAETLLLKGLASKSGPLYPGMSAEVTFTFAKAGQLTLTVPVQLSSRPNRQTLGAKSG